MVPQVRLTLTTDSFRGNCSAIELPRRTGGRSPLKVDALSRAAPVTNSGFHVLRCARHRLRSPLIGAVAIDVKPKSKSGSCQLQCGIWFADSSSQIEFNPAASGTPIRTMFGVSSSPYLDAMDHDAWLV